MFFLPLTLLKYSEYILIEREAFVILNGLDDNRAEWVNRYLNIEQAMWQYLLMMTQTETEEQLSYCSYVLNPTNMKSSTFLYIRTITAQLQPAWIGEYCDKNIYWSSGYFFFGFSKRVRFFGPDKVTFFFVILISLLVVSFLACYLSFYCKIGRRLEWMGLFTDDGRNENMTMLNCLLGKS